MGWVGLGWVGWKNSQTDEITIDWTKRSNAKREGVIFLGGGKR